MIFELHLTDSCNRSCPFCSFAKNNFIETHKNVKLFCDKVKHLNLENFQINLFGGEPLLNVDEIKYVIDFFYENKNCVFWLFTNGDLLDRIGDDRYFNRINIQISVYDIFKNSEKYVKWINKLDSDHLRFTYTFTQDDIDDCFDYIDICENLKTNYKIALSYSAGSWSRLSEDNVYLKARLVYETEMLNSLKKRKISYTLKPKIQKYIYYKYNIINNINYNNINNNYCISYNEYKKIFYNGKFINNNCIFNPKIPEKLDIFCLNCRYNNLCSKSCLMERINGKLPKKLCFIQKAEFDVVSKYIEQIF